MAEILQIEAASFEYAWDEEDFLRTLRERNCIGMVAEHCDQVVGFMIYELHETRLHLLNFAVHPKFRRVGVATQMMDRMISKLSSHRRTSITLEVRDTNVAAKAFFRSRGFRASKFLRAHYEDSGESALRMRYDHKVEEVGTV